MSTVIRTYLVLVSFVDTRIKPRTVKVEAAGRKAARRLARTEIARLHPDWTIAKAEATHEGAVVAPVKVEATVEAPAPKARKARKASATKPTPPVAPKGRGSRGGDPIKAAAWDRTVELCEADSIPFRSAEFYVVYKAVKAEMTAAVPA